MVSMWLRLNKMWKRELQIMLLVWVKYFTYKDVVFWCTVPTSIKGFSLFHAPRWWWKSFSKNVYKEMQKNARGLERDFGRDPFNQNFQKFRSKTQWIGSVQPEKFRQNRSTFWGGSLFPVGPVWMLVEWIAPIFPAATVPFLSRTRLIFAQLVIVRLQYTIWESGTG